MKDIVIVQLSFPFVTYVIKFFGEAWSNEFCKMIDEIEKKNWHNKEVTILAEYKTDEEDEEKETDKDYIILTEFNVRPLYASDDTRTILKEKGVEAMSYTT